MNAFQNINYLKWLIAHKKALIVVQVIAVIAGIIFSSPFFMPKQYKSFAVVYPYNFSVYSHETPTEQMMEFLKSRDIQEEVIKKFNLVKHYEIDSTADKEWKSKLLEKYERNIIVNSTEYEAVEIIAYDINPDTACKIVKEILNVLNDKVRTVQISKSMEVVKMWKRQLDMKKKECDSLSDLSKSLSTQYGLLDFGSQTREVIKAYYTNSSPAKSGEIAAQMKNMEEKEMELQAVNQHLGAALGNYDDIRAKYDDAQKDVNKRLTYSNVVTSPYVADKKSYPIRWLVVLITCIAAFIFSAIILMTAERLK
ncbi:MAG: Wzz/FepE/Etk N-terminal domain-containing protein [Bacteroidia bacterium]